jgi:hypothetical protein
MHHDLVANVHHGNPPNTLWAVADVETVDSDRSSGKTAMGDGRGVGGGYVGDLWVGGKRSGTGRRQHRFIGVGGGPGGVEVLENGRVWMLIHLKCIYFFKHFAQRFAPKSCHTWIKLLNVTLVLAKVFFLSVFARNKIREKYHGSFFTKRRDLELWITREGPRGPKEHGWHAPFPGRANMARLALEHHIPPSFATLPYIP